MESENKPDCHEIESFRVRQALQKIHQNPFVIWRVMQLPKSPSLSSEITINENKNKN